MGYFEEGITSDPEVEELARQHLLWYLSYTTEGLDMINFEALITELATWRAEETGGDVVMMRKAIAESCLRLLEKGNCKTKLNAVRIVDEGDRCAVCHEDFKSGSEVACMDCEHLFHDRCIKQWFKTKLNCPLCRFEKIPGAINKQSSAGRRNRKRGRDNFTNPSLSPCKRAVVVID